MLTLWMYLVVLLLVLTALQAGECVTVERISTDSTAAGIPRQAACQARLRREHRPRLGRQQVSVQAEGAAVHEGTQRLHFYVYKESRQTMQVRCLPAQDTRCTSGRGESCSCRSAQGGQGREGSEGQAVDGVDQHSSARCVPVGSHGGSHVRNHSYVRLITFLLTSRF